MDCVTAIDYKWKLECLSVLDPENAKKLGKLAKFFLVFREARKHLGKMIKKGRQKFSRENVEIFWWSPNR